MHYRRREWWFIEAGSESWCMVEVGATNATSTVESTNLMGRLLSCPQCRHEKVLRSRPLSASERMAALFMLSPFSCPHCSCRFLASRIGLDQPRHPIDRREHLRIPVRLYLSFSGGKVRGEGMVQDLSMGGCIIKSETQVHVDDIFYLEIATGQHDQPIEVAAMVRSISPRGIAFKFLRAAQDNKRLLAFVQAQTADHLRKSGTPSEVPVKS